MAFMIKFPNFDNLIFLEICKRRILKHNFLSNYPLSSLDYNCKHVKWDIFNDF